MASAMTHSFSVQPRLGWQRRRTVYSSSRRATRARLTQTQTPTSVSSRAEISKQIKEARERMAQDENVSVLMDSLRGANLNEDNFAKEGLKMRLMEEFIDGEEFSDELPLVYEPEAIASYWGKRSTSIVKRVLQLSQVSGGFISSLLFDLVRGELKKNEVNRAIELRDIITSLGPAYIKLGQALAIRPDILSPASMREMQKLCDKVPSFDNDIAMKCIEDELGAPWHEVYAELTPNPIAAASLGQVYKGKLKTGEQVAVKVQRPFVIETVTIDLFIIRSIGLFLRRFPKITERVDVVALLDEWASRFFEELDYEREGRNGIKFAQQMKDDLPQVVVPKTYMEYTKRRVLTIEWIDGEKLSQSTEGDVRSLVNVGVICYLKQLLETGFFHADPHPGNLIRTPDGRLAVLDFGLMTQITDKQKYGMIFAISHLIHRDYGAITEDFVSLDFIPPNVNLKPLQPALARVFDQALEGGGAKSINFQELASDLAQITFDYPFRIPPYFALIIRAIGVLEGIALVGDPDFAIVDESYPYIARRLLTDSSQTSQEALRYMIYGQGNVFDVDRLIDILEAFEEFTVAVSSARGSSGQVTPGVNSTGPSASLGPLYDRALLNFSDRLGPERFSSSSFPALDRDTRSRQALSFLLSDDGNLVRKFLLDELVKSADALSRVQLEALISDLGLGRVTVPLLLPIPGMGRPIKLAPKLTEEDRKQVDNISKLIKFLSGGNRLEPSLAVDILPYLPSVASEILPDFLQAFTSRLVARSIREVYNID